MVDARLVNDLYISKVADLRMKLATGTQVDLIIASGILRHLFLDGHPLVHQVNRRFKLKLKYRINARLAGPPQPPRGFGWKHYYLSLDPYPPGSSTPAPFEDVVERELLRSHVLTFEDRKLSVKDIIEHCAHVRGGVHLGNPVENSKAIDGADSMAVRGYPSTYKVLQEIICVIGRGLTPLTNAVIAEIEKNK